MDKNKIQEGVKLILEGIGEDIQREGLLETPDRIARMYEELAAGYTDDAAKHLRKRFHVNNNDMVLEKDIHFYSFCEHHMLPFYGSAAIAYIPNGEVVGLSKIARTVEVFAKRFQLQERLTAQIADVFMEELNPKGVMVLIEAEHMCMTMRGIKKPGTKTVTVVTRGVFDQDEKLQNQFYRMLERGEAEMERVNQICKHPLWVESVKKIQALEQQRIFCRHNIPHFLDVARLSWIENLEQGLGISKELIYAAAMLHDIGRHLQYTEQIPHDKGSAMLAEEILKDCGFTQEEQEQILSAILQHRTKDTETKNSLAGLLYRSDKKSRACLFCDAQKDCNWSSEKKNLMLTV